MALLLVSAPARKRSITSAISCSTNVENNEWANIIDWQLIDGLITVKARRLFLVFWQIHLLLLHFLQVDVDEITWDIVTISGVLFNNCLNYYV